jgi:light-regulated signal transduction histidine kinase (bacteriophytochrome)
MNLAIAKPAYPVEHNNPLRMITHWIQRSLDLQEILNATAAEAQQFLAMDRVKIYKFHADGSGQVIAESLTAQQRLPTLLGLNFPADDIPPHARQLFIKARVRNVVDVASGLIGQSRLQDPHTGNALPADWTVRPLDPCHQEYLTTMGVKASFDAPIFHREQLWGLLVAHHAEAKEIPLSQLYEMQFIVDQLAVAIAQATLLSEVQAKAEREATLHRITAQLHAFDTIELQAALEATVAAFSGSGGRLFLQTGILPGTPDAAFPDALPSSGAPQALDPIVYTCGSQPTLPAHAPHTRMEQYHAITSHFQGENPQPWAIADLYQTSELRTLQPAFRATAIRSLLLLPLVTRQKIVGYLTIFRDELTTETLWAGYCDPDHRQDYPRQSFNIWRQSQAGQIQPWLAPELELALDLSQVFASAIEQYALYQQIFSLNATLEAQVQQRTAQLAQTLQDLQQTQTQLIQAEKMSSLGHLVAGIAHEINNPVSFIHGNIVHASEYMETLLRCVQICQDRIDASDPDNQALLAELDIEFVMEDVVKVMGSMEVGAERIREIVLSLRNFSRLDQADVKPVDLHEGLDSTLMILQHRLKATVARPEIQLVQHYGELPLVECYASQINQVFMNILANAIDALENYSVHRSFKEIQEQPNVITIATQLINPDQVRVTISDNGAGMTKAVQGKIFDPFYTTKPIGQGTGLGLAISYQIIVEKHGGRIECMSAPGQGTTFVIDLPRLPGLKLTPVGAIFCQTA